MADWFKDLGSTFSKIGSEVRSGANELRKVAGIGVGKVKVELEGHDFHPGDTIRGKVTVALDEDTDAKRLVVGLGGSRKKVSYSKGSDGRPTQSTHDETVYELERELDGERSYRTGEYPFELVVPTDATSRPEITTEGIVGAHEHHLARVRVPRYPLEAQRQGRCRRFRHRALTEIAEPSSRAGFASSMMSAPAKGDA